MMKKSMISLLTASVLLGGAATATATAAGPDVLMVYDDSVRPDFYNFSWAQHSLTQHQIVHSGRAAIEMVPNRDNGLYLYKDRVAFVSQYDTLQLWVHGGATGGQALDLVLQAGGMPVAAKSFAELIPGGIPANAWTKVELDLAALELPNGIFDGLLIRGTTDGEQAAVYFDDIALLNKASVTPVEAVANGLTVYDDYLNRPDFVNYSLAEHDVNQTGYVHTGIHALQMTPNRDLGLYLYKDRVASTAEYRTLRFWINGGADGGQQLKLVLLAGGVPVADKQFAELLPTGSLAADSWTKVELNLADLHLPNGLFDGILIAGTTDGVQPAVYLDDMALLRGE
ncbi:hypothetical protein EV586_11312 [Tumebacillus sp. BK434]|uniref:hypothetical protein n=1 Tax=Tumebacillus sp. BK434 TaxID=2512169 RepID=UPI00104F9949|nr:hypothetical protein [Tumebacillus sp. BK434]TCP52203.1 hypothetical protein EV586_11312 [Tumebacillus sp. BK434]